MRSIKNASKYTTETILELLVSKSLKLQENEYFNILIPQHLNTTVITNKLSGILEDYIVMNQTTNQLMYVKRIGVSHD